MSNIIHSDLYRIRKGAAARNSIIGLMATILFMGLTFFTMTSNGFQLFIDDASNSVQNITSEDMAEMSEAFDAVQSTVPVNAAEFGREMLAEDFLPFFFLPLIITIFCADFTAGTHRNTLSYESSRIKVYLSKLVLSILCAVALNLITLAFSWFVGGVLFGFGGFTAEYLLQTLIFLLLLLPVQLGVIGFGHCLVAFTKKSSSTIAAYLLVLAIVSVILQTASLLPSLQWLTLLDWNGVGSLLAAYWTMPIGNIIIAAGTGLVIATATTALGISHYRKTDMA